MFPITLHRNIGNKERKRIWRSVLSDDRPTDGHIERPVDNCNLEPFHLVLRFIWPESEEGFKTGRNKGNCCDECFRYQISLL